MLTGLLDRSSKQSLQYAYHSGIWFLAFFAAWVVQFHRTNYTYDYVTQSVHVATPDTSKHSYWTFDTLTHSQFKAAVGGDASMKSSINKNLCITAKHCFDSKGTVSAACTNPHKIEDDGSVVCTVPTKLQQNQIDCDAVDKANYPLKEKMCQEQFQPAAELQLHANEYSTFSISGAHSPRVLMFIVLTIMTVSNFYMCITSLYRNDVKWFRGIVSSFARAVAGDGKLHEDDKLCMFKRYLVAPFFTVIMLIWWFAFYTTTEHEVFWPRPFGSLFYGLIALGMVLFLGAGVDNYETDDRNGSKATDATAENDFVPSAVPAASAPPLPDSEKQQASTTAMQLDVSGFTGHNKLRTDAFLQPGRAAEGKESNYKAELVQHWSSGLTAISITDYTKHKPRYSYFTLMQTWVLPFLFLSVYLLKHNYHIDSDLTTIFVAVLLFGVLEIASKRLAETEFMFAEIASSTNTAQMLAPISVIRLLLLCFQAIIVWFVYSVANWNFDAYSNGYWHVGMASDFNKYDNVQMMFSVSFVVYFAVLGLCKLYTLTPNSMEYARKFLAANELNAHFDEVAVLILNIFVAFVFVYELGMIGGVMFENENLMFDNPLFLTVLASKV